MNSTFGVPLAAVGVTMVPPEVVVPDGFLTLVYVICTLVGLPGNILAACYFTRVTTRRDISCTLYTIASILDVMICVFQFPVLISLMSRREAVLLKIEVICTAWRLIFKTLQRMTVFIVMLISVYRTVLITRPLTVVNNKAILGVLYTYTIYICVEMAVLAPMEVYSYDPWSAYCYESENFKKINNTINNSLYIISLGATAIIIFISFIMSVVVIRRSMAPELAQNPAHRPSTDSALSREDSGNQLKRHATTTIMIFTFTYILCNLPSFINLIFWVYTMTGPGYPGPIYDNFFMSWYIWNIVDVLSVLVNSACNPCIYFMRMKEYQRWVLELGVVKVVCGEVRRVWGEYKGGRRASPAQLQTTKGELIQSWATGTSTL